MIIENKPGGAAQIAAVYVKNAQPDGHTLFVADVGSHAINPSLYSKLPYDPVKDFEPISLMVESTHVLVVPTDSKIRTLADLVSDAKQHPGEVTYASVGVGSAQHLLGEMFKFENKVDVIHVPYKGSAQVMPDVLAGRVGFFFSSVFTAAPMIREGKLRPLAAADTKRSPLLPDVPTFAEAGLPTVKVNVWLGLLAPKGTPDTIITRLNAETVSALRSADLADKLEQSGAAVIASTPAEFAAVIASDTQRLGALIKAAGAHID